MALAVLWAGAQPPRSFERIADAVSTEATVGLAVVHGGFVLVHAADAIAADALATATATVLGTDVVVFV